jgi:two-component system OmpR family response regulator
MEMTTQSKAMRGREVAAETATRRDFRRVLLIEDDERTAREILDALAERGFAVEHADNGTDGLARARSGEADMLVVDRQLPDLDGLALIATMRAEKLCTLVLVLSALGSVEDLVRGLRAGSDDYLVKPCAFPELVARLEALLRRRAEARDTKLRVGPLALDLIDRTVERDSRLVELLPREFKLLEYMMRRAGQVVTRAMLLEEVWHYRFARRTNLVDVHMGRLRRKIDAADEPPMIHSARGAGFILRAPE